MDIQSAVTLEQASINKSEIKATKYQKKKYKCIISSYPNAHIKKNSIKQYIENKNHANKIKYT